MDIATTDLRLRTVLGRLEAIIDMENSRIGRDPNFDLQTSNAHKSRCLYELAMLTRDMLPEDLPKAFTEQMRTVRGKLVENARRLSSQLDAVRSVVQLLKDAVREQEGDGTYSQEQFRMGYQP
ncbi:hypothetical protein LXM94_06155 [Rhizobium sp. TRM95111]|uniref:hypothetical protein n=1 Tax=Rhizobium alarense TaxID=2846851 RepID=UPI001F32B5C2|nr:hypothetical protein [Rhizobium alarense]MCF3639548.1 hypothetical protein [Rhizobium alarense]